MKPTPESTRYRPKGGLQVPLGIRAARKRDPLPYMSACYGTAIKQLRFSRHLGSAKACGFRIRDPNPALVLGSEEVRLLTGGS